MYEPSWCYTSSDGGVIALCFSDCLYVHPAFALACNTAMLIPVLTEQVPLGVLPLTAPDMERTLSTFNGTRFHFLARIRVLTLTELPFHMMDLSTPFPAHGVSTRINGLLVFAPYCIAWKTQPILHCSSRDPHSPLWTRISHLPLFVGTRCRTVSAMPRIRSTRLRSILRR